MSYVLALLLLAGIVRLTLRYWDHHDLDDPRFSRARFLAWAAKGLAAPVLIWLLLNVGISERYPPVLAEIEVARAKGHFAEAWFGLLPPAVCIVASLWAAATFVWLLCLHAAEMDCSRRDLLSSLLLWSALFSPIALMLIYALKWMGAGLAVVVVLMPVISEQFSLGNPRKRQRHPVYDDALAKLRAGEHSAAEKELLRQLERCDSDYQGWLLLAELYATAFKDLPEADRLVRQLCRQPDITRDQMSQALHRLADWHLQIGKNPEGARRALQEICDAFPATHLGDVAQKRIDHTLGAAG